MLLNLSVLIAKYKMNIRGVVQVGAHKGQEHDEYVAHGVKNIVYIEPGSDAYTVLKEKFGTTPGVTLFNCACGDVEGISDAYVEHTNQGMSSSLLPPDLHLTQHKEVIFDDRAPWKIRRLDNLDIDRILYNLLNMDVQGFEAHVLRGAVNVLEHIDYIYTEVNRASMYKGCALVEDLDRMLGYFQRVETGWASETHGWGDALYIRKSLL